MKKRQGKNNTVIYQAPNGAIELRGDFSHDMLWATQGQIATAFDVDVRTVNEHIKNIYTSEELKIGSTIRKFRIVQNESGRIVKRQVDIKIK